MLTSPNPMRCPLCGQPNQCAVAAGKPAEQCWCMQTRIAPEVLEHIPPELRDQACVCAACGQRAVTHEQRD